MNISKTTITIVVVLVFVVGLPVFGFLLGPTLFRGLVDTPLPKAVDKTIREIQWTDNLILREVANKKAILGATSSSLNGVKKDYENLSNHLSLLVQQITDELNIGSLHEETLELQLTAVKEESNQLLNELNNMTYNLEALSGWAKLVENLFITARQDWNDMYWDINLSTKAEKQRQLVISQVKKILLPAWKIISPSIL